MRRKKKNSSSSRKGFSLLEVIIAIFVISVGMTAAVMLLGNGIKESISSRDQVIAVMLAQEGVELVRNIRDTNWEKRRESDPDLETFKGIENGTKIIEADASPSLEQANNDNVELKYENGLYKHSGGSNTKFSRKIFISGDDTSPTRTVTSVVIWNGDEWPSGDIDTKKCNLWNDCAFTKVVLTKWGEVPDE
jgi:prepilin-type N-terminal cleavage/methylation domain-containing protein